MLRITIRLLFFAPLVLFSAAWMSGPLRAASGISATFSLTFVFAALFAVIIFYRQKIFLQQYSIPWPALGFAALSSCLACWRLYNVCFDGLVSVGGGDAADHIYYKELFFIRDPAVYNGMVGFHALAHWTEQFFGFQSFQSFRFIFYLTIVLFIVVTFLLAQSTARFYGPEKSLAELKFFAIFFLLSCYPAEHFLLPVLHYLQADGFYPQLFGLVPIFLGVLGYVLCEVRSARAAILLITIVVSRFTYGLNLGDLVLTSGFLIASDYAAGASRVRVWILLISTVLLGGWVYFQLASVVMLDGRTIEYDYARALGATTILSLLSIALTRLRFIDSFAAHDRALRLFSFAGLYGITSSAVQGVYLLSGRAPGYYFLKYSFYPAVVVCVASLIILASVIEALLSRNRVHRASMVLLIMFSIFGLSLQMDGFRIFRVSYKDRIGDACPAKSIEALADLQAMNLITGILQSEHKHFGGFITSPDWALANFTNAALGYYRYRKQPFYRDPKLLKNSGTCIFWNSESETLERLRNVAKQRALQLIENVSHDPRVHVLTYEVPWSPTKKQLSYLCR